MSSDIRRKIQSAIDTLRNTVTGCEIAMLVDRDTGLVLSKSNTGTVPQDYLDRLVSQAQDMLDDSLPEGFCEPHEKDATLCIYRYGAKKMTAVVTSGNPAGDIVVCEFAERPEQSGILTATEALFELTCEDKAA